MKAKRISENIIEDEDGKRYFLEVDDSVKWLDIPELKISVEIEVHDKDKSWDKLGLSEREGELLTDEQCKFIMNTPKYAKILKMDGSSTKDDFFIKQPYDINRRNGYVARFYAGSGYAYLNCGEYPSGSGSYLGVRFVRALKVKK